MARFAFFLVAALATTVLSAEDTVKVFILAGQSNMQGHGKVKAEERANGGKGSLEWLVKNPRTKEKYKHLVDKNGDWVERDDVQIHYLDRAGKLAPGYGAREGLIGPELGFGTVVGDAFDEPVLLIKLAWGGKSLAKDFRPPSTTSAGAFSRKLAFDNFLSIFAISPSTRSISRDTFATPAPRRSRRQAAA